MTIAIFGNTNKRSTMEKLEHILRFLDEHGATLLLSQEIRHEMNLMDRFEPYDVEKEQKIDCAVSVGGDGTFLTTAALVGDRDIPILGINCGHLGFLSEATTDNVESVLQSLLDGEYSVEERSLLQVTTVGGGHIMMPYALNEVAVMKQELSSMIAVEAHVNGEYLHTYKADGLVISTPTGSTAYNLSVGGPILSPKVHGIVISPVATHSLNVRPVVAPDDISVSLKIRSRSGSYLISVDGRSQTLHEDVELVISKAPYCVKLLKTGNRSFVETMRTKLSWGV